MKTMRCPLPSCTWTVKLVEDPHHLGEVLHADLAEMVQVGHLINHRPAEFVRAVAAASPEHRDERTLVLLCPVPGCRWERDVDLTPPGFWRGLCMPDPVVMVQSADAERGRHLSRHHVMDLVRTLTTEEPRP